MQRFESARGALVAATVTGLLCLAAVWLVFGPLDDWTRYPLAYTNTADGLANLWIIKTVLETGWVSVNPALGAPFGATVFDFPHPEVLFLAFYRAAGALTSNVAFVHNVFYLAGFPLVAWPALAVLRGELRVAWPLAVAGAFVFSWLPYHFLRLEHLHLSNYAVVPLAAWLLLRVAGQRPPFFEHGRVGPSSAAIWLAAVAVGWTSVYYAFFAIVLLLATGAVEGIVTRSLRPVASGLLVVLAITAALGLALTPLWRHRAAEGPNPATASRSVGESDIYSLRLVHLLLPSDHHRFAPLGALARTYGAHAPFVNENRSAALGMIGALGFVLLVAHTLTGNRVLPATAAMATLGRATVVATLFAVSGGLGALVALVVTPQFRALNRISVFIAFFSIAALVAAMDRALSGVAGIRARITLGLAVALVAVAVLDQEPALRPDAASIARTYDSDRAFVARIEQILPPGAMVYQVPYTQFPEVPPHLHEPHYSPMRMYVHSRTLRWSYGGMKGRPGDYWHLATDRLPLPDRVTRLRAAGFTGVVLDRAALPEGGHADDERLAALGAVHQFESSDRTLGFYTLPPVQGERGASRQPLFVAGRGFYRQEGAPPHQWNWSDGTAEVVIHHAGHEDVAAELTCVLQSLGPRRIVVRAPGHQGTTVDVAGAALASPVQVHLVLRPGWNTVVFDTDRPAMRPPGGRDQRPLAFMVRDLAVAPTPSQQPTSTE